MQSATSDSKRSKGDKRARTRLALVRAAAELVGTKGLEQTSLEDVAERAGMTRGAIYGNFKDRDELFLAVMEARWQPIVPKFKSGANYAQQMRILAQAVIEALPARRTASIGAASYQLYVLTHEKMRARFVQINSQAYRRAAQDLLNYLPEAALPMPAHVFVRVLHGLIDGLTFLSFVTPELITEDVILAAFEALGASKPRRFARPRTRSRAADPSAR
jgi:AcrR family transcriptional regulator